MIKTIVCKKKKKKLKVKKSVVGWLLVISYPLSEFQAGMDEYSCIPLPFGFVISYQLSVISYQLSVSAWGNGCGIRSPSSLKA